MTTHNIGPQTYSIQTFQTNCHNCGAPIKGPKCEYCGTVFNISVPITLQTIANEINEAKREFENSCRKFRDLRTKEIEQALRYMKYGIM